MTALRVWSHGVQAAQTSSAHSREMTSLTATRFCCVLQDHVQQLQSAAVSTCIDVRSYHRTPYTQRRAQGPTALMRYSLLCKETRILIDLSSHTSSLPGEVRVKPLTTWNMFRSSLRHQRDRHMGSAHPYAPFPVERLEQAVALIPRDALTQEQQDLGSFGQSHTFTR